MSDSADRDPIAEEAARILRERSDVRARLDAYNRDFPNGKVKLIEHEEVRGLLRQLGVPLDRD